VRPPVADCRATGDQGDKVTLRLSGRADTRPKKAIGFLAITGVAVFRH
jgi:hypothetical protein